MELLQYFADRIHNIYVLFLAFTADVVRLPSSSLQKDLPDGLAVVLDVKPVAHVLSVTVNRERFAFDSVQYDQGDQFFGKMVRTVVVRTVRDSNRQSVGVKISPHQVVRGGLGSRVGTSRVIGRCLEEITGFTERSVDLVGADMMKPHVLSGLPSVVGWLRAW